MARESHRAVGQMSPTPRLLRGQREVGRLAAPLHERAIEAHSSASPAPNRARAGGGREDRELLLAVAVRPDVLVTSTLSAGRRRAGPAPGRSIRDCSKLSRSYASATLPRYRDHSDQRAIRRSRSRRPQGYGRRDQPRVALAQVHEQTPPMKGRPDRRNLDSQLVFPSRPDRSASAIEVGIEQHCPGRGELAVRPSRRAWGEDCGEGPAVERTNLWRSETPANFVSSLHFVARCSPFAAVEHAAQVARGTRGPASRYGRRRRARSWL